MTSLIFHVYTWPFIHCLYFIYARKFYVCSHGEITRKWKSTHILSVFYLRTYNLRACAWENYATVEIHLQFCLLIRRSVKTV